MVGERHLIGEDVLSVLNLDERLIVLLSLTIYTPKPSGNKEFTGGNAKAC